MSTHSRCVPRYVDLVLLHQPLDVPGQWKGLEQALAMNLTRAIGISNFDLNQIEKLLQTATVTPAVNQCDVRYPPCLAHLS